MHDRVIAHAQRHGAVRPAAAARPQTAPRTAAMEWWRPVPLDDVLRRVSADGRKAKFARVLHLKDLVAFGLGKMVGAGVLVLLGIAKDTSE